MIRFSRRTLRSLVFLSLITVGLLPSPAFSGSRETSNPLQRTSAITDESLETLYERLEETQIQWDQTRRALRKARQRRYPRGPALEDLRQRARKSEEAVAQAEEAFLRRVDQARYKMGETREWNTFVERAEQIQEARRLRDLSQ